MNEEKTMKDIFPETSKYDDIINLPHPSPRYHQPMSIEARAAQFAPFAAVQGHKEAIEEEEEKEETDLAIPHQDTNSPQDL